MKQKKDPAAEKASAKEMNNTMRKNFGARPILYPQPVLIIATYDENGNPDAMNAAWGGTADEDKLFLCLSAGHKTTKNLLARKAFTVSVGTEQELVPCDYVGVVSANDVEDKFQKTGWHTEKSAFVDAPLIEELPLAFECELESYDEETGMLLGKVKNVCADERILSDKGKIDPEKLSPITFDPANNAYWRLGGKAGNAFRDGLQLKK